MNERWTEKAIYVIVAKKQFWTRNFCAELLSASSWGCELKLILGACSGGIYCQPLREAVSWNLKYWYCSPSPVKSASSWGCELKYGCNVHILFKTLSASSWGCELKYERSCDRNWKEPSASSWGCELKFIPKSSYIKKRGVSLFVRLWVEMWLTVTNGTHFNVSLFVRLWVEMLHLPAFRHCRQVSLFVRLWVEI